MHIHCPQKRRIWVKYYIGGHRALADILPSFQDVRCRAPISNRKAGGWVSHAERGNVSQTPVAYIQVALSKYVHRMITRNSGWGKK